MFHFRFFFFFCFCEFYRLFPISVYYLDSQFENFIGPISLFESKIQWKPVDTQKTKLFMVPSFCDSMVTLGSGPSGITNNTLKKISQTLKNYLAHGFTHIQSIADSKWVRDTTLQIQHSKPDIFYHTPIINQQLVLKKFKNLTSYISVDSEKELFEKINQFNSKKFFFIHRYSENVNFNFDSYTFYRLLKISKQKNFTPIVLSYGDSFSIIEIINSGITTLFHPIPVEIEKELSFVSLLKWGPSLNMFFWQTLEPETNMDKLLSFSHQSVYFRENSLKIKNNLDKAKRKQAQAEYSSYLKFFQKNQNNFQKMLLSSGAGNLNAYHGFSGWVEIFIFHSVLQDISKIFRINQNTCRFISQDYDGTIKKNFPQNFILLNSNPLKNFENLFDIHSVFKNSKLVYKKSPS